MKSQSYSSAPTLLWNCFLFIYFFKINLFYFLAAVGLHCCPWAFCSCGEWGLLFTVATLHLLCVGSLFLSMGSRHIDFGHCSAWAPKLWHRVLVSLRHVGSSWTKDRTSVPCIARWILNHWTTGEPWHSCFKRNPVMGLTVEWSSG